MTSLLQGFKSVVLTSERIDATAHFYREVLELPLEPERHRGTERHWAGPVGPLHFAIHERDGFWLPSRGAEGQSATIVSFTAPDLGAVRRRLEQHGIGVTHETKIGPMEFLAVTDPDGRHVCFGTPWPERKPRD